MAVFWGGGQPLSFVPHPFRKGIRFFKGLAQKLVERGHVLDVFAGSLDQMGAAEARVAVEMTGGVLVLAETFESEQIGKSLHMLFARDEQVRRSRGEGEGGVLVPYCPALS